MKTRATLPVTHEWLVELSLDPYRPMRRLLDHRDIGFLRAQRGFQPEMEKRLRAQRVLVFREYLRMLDADFRRLCDGLDAGTPVRLRWQAAFAWKVLEVQFQVTLYRFRLAEVDVLPLLGVFEALRAELGRNTLHAERATA